MKMKLTGKIALSTRIKKNIIFLAREALISGKGLQENLGKMDRNSETYCYAG